MKLKLSLIFNIIRCLVQQPFLKVEAACLQKAISGCTIRKYGGSLLCIVYLPIDEIFKVSDLP